MISNEEDDNKTYVVLVNIEEQYSLWPLGKSIPKGWRATGQEGSKNDCARYVEKMWTDMRPLSLRKKMEERAEAKT